MRKRIPRIVDSYGERSIPEIVGPDGDRPNQHDFVSKCPFRQFAAQHIANGKIGEGFRRAEVINEQSPGLISGDEPIPHLHSLCPIGINVHCQWRLTEVVPGT